MTKESGFSDVRLERRSKSEPVNKSGMLPPARIDILVRVRARCNDCGTLLNAYRASEAATPGTFFPLRGGNVQITCAQCEQQWIFNQDDFP